MIIFDTETTDLPEVEGTPLDMQPRMIEFAGVKLDNNFNEVEEFQRLINPGVPIPPDAVKIHNITDEQVAEEPKFAERFRDLAKFFLGESTLVAHNIGFDRKILRFELARSGLVERFPWPPRHICTVELGEKHFGHRKNLTEAFEIITGETMTGAHRAMNDVRATARILRFYHEQGLFVI